MSTKPLVQSVVFLFSSFMLAFPVQADQISFEVDWTSNPFGAPSENYTASILAVIPHGHHAIDVSVTVTASPNAEDIGQEPTILSVGNTGYQGYQVATVALSMLANGSFLEAEAVQVDITTQAGHPEAISCLRPDPQHHLKVEQQVAKHVANPQDLSQYAPPRPAPVDRESEQPALHAGKTAPRGFQPTYDPSLDGSGVQYLIVTSEEMQSAFQPLADWKTQRGIGTQIRTIEWIESRTRQGIDRAETLRNFLIEAFQLWGVEYVLLGGDSEVIPARYGRTSLYSGTADEYSPSDMYFSCLDGTWNGDADAFWGEGEPTSGGGESEADILPEIIVGRAPVKSAGEVTIFVNKVIGYEKPDNFGYQHKALFAHEVLVPANWSEGQGIAFDGAPTAEDMINNSLPAGMTPLRYYDNYTNFPGSTQLSKAGVINEMNQAVGVVNHLGHGYRYTMSLGDESLINKDADLLSNSNKSFVLFLANCTAVAFDFDCLAEKYLLNAGGGASGVIGASRSVSAIFVTFYNKALYRQMFEFGSKELGRVLNDARLERSGQAELDSQDRQLHFSLNTLGDPAMQIFSGAVETTSMSLPSSMAAQETAIQVTVQQLVDSAPVLGAHVVAYKEDEVFATATTDTAGLVNLNVFPQTAGPLLVTSWGPNIQSRTDTITVLQATPPLLRVSSFLIDDDNSGSSSGNGDGSVDAGETVELTVELENSGQTEASSVYVLASSGDPNFTVLSDSVAIDSLVAGDKQQLQGKIVVQVDPSVPDGTALDLAADIYDGAAGHWPSKLHLQVSAPRLEVTRVDITSTGGNDRQLSLELKNYGSGEQPDLVGLLMPADSLLVVIDSVNIPPIGNLQTSWINDAFEVDVSNGTGGGATAVLTDSYGRTLNHYIDFVAPVKPAAPVADPTASSSFLRLTWTPSVEPDIHGYHVFRALAGGSFSRVTSDLIWHGDFRDSGTESNTDYEYYTIAVDSSGIWSPPSDTLAVSTTPALLAGFPLTVDDPTSSSVVVGDIDGNSSQEILVGSVGIYAWHTNAQEVLDGDNDPATFGVFNTTVNQVVSSLSLGQLDGQPGLEIVAAPWLSNSVYVYRADGTVLNGWPQTPANGGNAGYWASPVVDDLDGDTSPEVLAISKDGWLYGWHADGTPIIPATDGKIVQVGAWNQTTPAVADFDNDGNKEIVVAATAGNLHVVQLDGTDFPGFPLALGAGSKTSPAIGDVDDDGTLEIVAGTINDQLHVFHDDGTYLSGWPVTAEGRAPDLGPSPALGDLDGDGKLEIVYPTVPSYFPSTSLEVFDYQGNVILSKPLGGYTQVTPVLADLDGDGSVDIVIGGETGILYAWDRFGNDISGFPIATGDFIRGTPMYTDVDLDGKGDLVLAGWNRQVYVWQLTGAYRQTLAPWPAFHGGVGRNGALPADFPTSSDPVVPAHRLSAVWYPNPFNPRITLQLAVPRLATATTPVVVDVYDVRGSLVQRLVDDDLLPGNHRILWNGVDRTGAAVSSGIYFYQVRAGNRSLSGKITLLR